MTRGNIRPGGRTEKVRQIVADTVLQLIKDGSGEFTMLEVAERSGVARSTLYARWPTREALIAEALSEHNAIFKVEPRADWREHLHAIAVAFRDFSARPDEIAINGMIAHMGPGFLNEETHRQWMSISERMTEPLRAAQAAGQIRQGLDTSLVVSTLFTTIAGLIGFAKDMPSDEYLVQLVDLLIGGCEA
ncbi:TetR/AcrR family transcriptional regulator [Novosphingobium mathurense]|uniref:Transcriptional regulator, TetR family n=1 Tax=Novosphingobium mathurense TaxID=428990 RepID=A0A1U6HTR6_9SPHN|nr:TetR/AcrR family transcriptional regulator [Novosphingobium mathurense]SLJ99193.1 transcriptional regulator, TetR family [Novosphingobium mathurense]